MAGQNGRAGEPVATDNRLSEFVADLARLRRDAGQPSLREMAGTAHYSHTALSSVLSGTRLPSQDLTLAFVRACGGDEDAWRARWHRENVQLYGTSRQPAAGRRGLIAAAAVLVLAAAAVIVLVTRPGPFARRATGRAAGSAAPAAADGADPQQERCQFDAVSAQTVQVPDRDPAQPLYGSLTLRFSPHCRAAWPLFVSTQRVPTGVTIRLRTTRPSDGAVSRFDYPFMVQSQVYSVFGNVLQTIKGCVSVTVEISTADNHGTLASAATPCVKLG